MPRHRGIGWERILEYHMQPNKNPAQGEKMVGGKDHEGSFQITKHYMGTALMMLCSALRVAFRTNCTSEISIAMDYLATGKRGCSDNSPHKLRQFSSLQYNKMS